MDVIFTRQRIIKILKVLLAIGIMLGIFISSIYLVSYLLGPPDLDQQQTTIFYNNQGEIFEEDTGMGTRYEVDLSAVPTSLIDATLSTEDQRFYKHKGLDFKRIAGAAVQNIKNRSLKEGASTLTQQYARNLYLSHEKTWSRKIKETFYAIRIEMFYSKADILQGYLNTIYYGHGAYGIEAASKQYFNKSAKHLTLAESAMLAGIPKGPTYYSPLNDLERAQTRQQQILTTMFNNKQISEIEFNTAKKEQLTYQQIDNKKDSNNAPYFRDTVLREAARVLDLEIEAVRSSGLQIHTTLDTNDQDNLEKQINQKVNDETDVEVGAIAMDPNNGAIQALVGGKDYDQSAFNRATQAKRQPGSTFKPFLYYAALQNGFTPSTMLESKPTTFKLKNGETYKPRNYNGYYADDAISLAQAIALSDNVYAVKTHLYLGADTLAQTATEFGINVTFPPVASLALGTSAVSLHDLVKGYSMIANNGTNIEPFTITKIIDQNGKQVYSRQQKKKGKNLNPQTTFILTQLLTGMFDEQLNGYSTVTGAPIADKLTKTYAGKSGTTDTDSWMVGYSPSLATGVWVGYDDNRSMEKVAETKSAKEIWAGFMENAHDDNIERFTIPSGVVGVPIDPETGKRATPYCPTSRVMYYKKGSEPQNYCTTHVHQEKQKSPKTKKGLFEKWFKLFMD